MTKNNLVDNQNSKKQNSSIQNKDVQDNDVPDNNVRNSDPEENFITRSLEVPFEFAQKRLDQALALLFSDFSRARLKRWLEKGYIKVDGKILRPKDKVRGGEIIDLKAPVETTTEWQGEEIPLSILYEDEEILVINKPMNCVTHPASGHLTGTLVNALIHHYPPFKEIPRAGIVHRLDKDTTGLLVVAKTLKSHTQLVKALQKRQFKREYDAIVMGDCVSGGKVEAPLGRHPVERKKRAVIENGKPAVTHYRISERFRNHSLLKVILETGRTHQIRVHMAHIQHPIVGDKTYGGRLRFPAKASEELRSALQHFPRQALHARKLGLEHPVTGVYMEWEMKMPEDMLGLVKILQKDKKDHPS